MLLTCSEVMSYLFVILSSHLQQENILLKTLKERSQLQSLFIKIEHHEIFPSTATREKIKIKDKTRNVPGKRAMYAYAGLLSDRSITFVSLTFSLTMNILLQGTQPLFINCIGFATVLHSSTHRPSFSTQWKQMSITVTTPGISIIKKYFATFNHY